MTKNVKLISSLASWITVIVMLLSMFLLPSSEAHAINTPWLSTSGRSIKDPQGNTVILRGVSLIDLSVADASTRTVTQRIDMATDNANGWYAHVIRLPVYPEAID